MDAPTALSAWESYYVIVGSSAAALTGLQFVVMALISDSEARAGTTEIATFGTPTIVHFCGALLVAAVLSAPWHTLTAVAGVIGASGVFGIAYTMVIIRRAHRTTVYKPVLEDWIWHTFLPFVAYTGLLLASAFLPAYERNALFGIAAATLLLVFIGIHNSWDTVTYIVTMMRPEQGSTGAGSPPAPASPDATRGPASGAGS